MTDQNNPDTPFRGILITRDLKTKNVDLRAFGDAKESRLKSLTYVRYGEMPANMADHGVITTHPHDESLQFTTAEPEEYTYWTNFGLTRVYVSADLGKPISERPDDLVVYDKRVLHHLLMYIKDVLAVELTPHILMGQNQEALGVITHLLSTEGFKFPGFSEAPHPTDQEEG